MDYPRQKKMAVWWLLRVVHQDMLVGHASGHAIAFDNDSLVRHAKKWDWGFCCSERDLSCFYLCWSCFLFFFFGTRFEMKTTLSWLLGLPKKTRQFLPARDSEATQRVGISWNYRCSGLFFFLAHSSLAKIRGYFQCSICLVRGRWLFNRPDEFFLSFFCNFNS